MENARRHSRSPVFTQILLATSVVFFGACGTEGSTNSTSTTSIVVTTTSEFTNPSETYTPETFPVSSESATTRIECPTQKISLDTKEPFGDILRCTTGWAVGIPERIAATFNDNTDVEAEWVLANTSSGWKVVGICHIYYPIYSTGSTCSPAYENTAVKVALLPPMPVQCTLWSAASWSEFTKETGCPKSD